MHSVRDADSLAGLGVWAENQRVKCSMRVMRLGAGLQYLELPAPVTVRHGCTNVRIMP